MLHARNATELYKNKYLCLINNKKIDILSNLEESDFLSLIIEISKRTEQLLDFEITDCLEFFYTKNDGITLADLYKYL